MVLFVHNNSLGMFFSPPNFYTPHSPFPVYNTLVNINNTSPQNTYSTIPPSQGRYYSTYVVPSGAVAAGVIIVKANHYTVLLLIIHSGTLAPGDLQIFVFLVIFVFFKCFVYLKNRSPGFLEFPLIWILEIKSKPFFLFPVVHNESPLVNFSFVVIINIPQIKVPIP